MKGLTIFTGFNETHIVFTNHIATLEYEYTSLHLLSAQSNVAFVFPSPIKNYTIYSPTSVLRTSCVSQVTLLIPIKIGELPNKPKSSITSLVKDLLKSCWNENVKKEWCL